VIMAATFVTDLGTATALSVLFIQPTLSSRSSSSYPSS